LTNNDDFHTFKEYMKKDCKSLTASMEDYLEMIYRLSIDNGFTRINELSKALNVQSPSATKMVQRLAELKLLKYEKYGVLLLEQEGKTLGNELLTRHNIIESFIKIIGVDKTDALQETEKIEHTVSKKTIKCIEDFIEFIKENPDILTRYSAYRFTHKF
jgi:Mn-dependent DtxR family transcriptional regulator